MHNIIRAKGYRKIFQILSLRIFLFSLTTDLPKEFKGMIMNISVSSWFLPNSEGKARRLCVWLWRWVKYFTDFLCVLLISYSREGE